MGLAESCEKVGDGGAVDIGDPGLDFFVILCAYGSSSSWECDLDIGCDEYAYCDRPGSRLLPYGWYALVRWWRLECERWPGPDSSLEAASARRSMGRERPFGLVLLLLKPLER